MNVSSGNSSLNISPTTNKQFVFDLTSSNLNDLESDLNEFDSFYASTEKINHTQDIERPQNPHFKNFESYKQTNLHGFDGCQM